MATVQGLRPDPWIDATLVEVAVGLCQHEEALERAEALAHDDEVSAFALNALLRQLTAVWQLDVESPPGPDLLAWLRAALLRRTGGDVVLAPHELTRERLDDPPRGMVPERVFDRDRYVSLPWYRLGLERCRAVARIEGPLGAPIGTGFLMTAADVGVDRAGVVVLTNAHVVPEQVAPDDAVVTFHALRQDGIAFEFPVTRVLCTSGPAALDTSVLLIDGSPDGVTPLPVARRLPNLAAQTRQRAFVIGHPHGWEDPRFSIQDNEMLDYDQTYLHYRSPTERGSSGSPVFDNAWRLVGLHHAGSERTPRLNGKGGTYAANEAILISAIRESLGGSVASV